MVEDPEDQAEHTDGAEYMQKIKRKELMQAMHRRTVELNTQKIKRKEPGQVMQRSIKRRTNRGKGEVR